MVGGGIALAAPMPAEPASTVTTVAAITPTPHAEALAVVSRSTKEHPSPSIVFRHGDISWLPTLAAEAGWPPHTWERLGHIILRESGACPNRRGGDVVNKKCVIVRVSEWTHRSDSSLLQINGVNYDLTRNKYAPICLKMGVCTQEPLMDPLTNLKAGKLLYDLVGWQPWAPQPKVKKPKP